MSKRIIFHVPSLVGGGAERVVVLIANEMAARGHDVTVLVWNAEGPNAALLSPTVRLTSLGFAQRAERFGKLATLKGVWQTSRLLRRLQPDAVFSAPEFANLVMTAALHAAGSRAKFFPGFHAAAALMPHRVGAILAVRLSKLVAARATRAIAVSKGVGRDLIVRGYPAAKIAVIYNPLPPVESSTQASYAWQETLAAMGDGPVIVTLGRLVPVKDHKTLLAAFASLRADRPARLVLFGEGPLEEATRAYADKLGIGKDVLFAGYVNDPAACYAAADLVVLSSISEGFGNVLIEAMAHGVPVVSTDAPHGPREILVDGRFGALVPVGDARALATAMATTLDRPIAPDVLRAYAANFDVKAIGDRYERLLR